MNLSGARVVAIDDTSSIRTFLRVSFEDEGAEFYGAANAEEGLNLCRELEPDLVVLDLGLPDRDGLEILPEIKNPEKGTVPSVVILSVRKGKDTIQEAEAKGADAYVNKPFVVDDLIEVIHEKLD